MGFSRYAVGAAPRVLSGVERATLVRRTYGLVFVGVVVTLLGAAFTTTQQSLMYAVAAHPFITAICWFIPLFMAQSQARNYPRNIVLTLLFTFIVGIWLAPMLAVLRQDAAGRAGRSRVAHLLHVRRTVALRHVQPARFQRLGRVLHRRACGC